MSKYAYAFACLTLLCSAAPLTAQDIPSDVVGDTGWIIYNADTLVLVRAADGHVWLQQNLGASQVATAHNDAAAFGDLYQWGRWDDGHGAPTSTTASAATLVPNNPLGLGLGSDKFYIGPNPSDWWGAGGASDTWDGATSSATNGIDPCVALGVEWHLPAQGDWANLLTLEGITNTATAFASNLKLPAAGARDGQTGTIINAGLYGQYWSHTSSGVYAKDLTVGDTWVNPDDDAYRGYGMCVRCLNKFLHVGQAEPHDSDRLRVFPNPSRGTFMFDNSGSRVGTVTLFGSDMRAIVAMNIGAASGVLSFEELPSGLYWIKLETFDGILWRMIAIER